MSDNIGRKSALVTGASRGIGRAIAISLGRAGYNCVVNYARNADAAREVERELQDAGAQAHLVQADVGSSADRARLVSESVSAFGRIDLLVNNAGIAPEVRADLLDASEESFDRLIGVNLKGPYFLTQLVARQMLAQRATAGKPPETTEPANAGKIITVSSISAYTASINRGDYCVAKAGLSMMTQLFAARLADEGINVYEIRPGIIATDMTGPVKAKYDQLIADGLTPIRRWGQTDDIARAVVAIATGAFPFSTGEVFNIDGGFHLRRL